MASHQLARWYSEGKGTDVSFILQDKDRRGRQTEVVIGVHKAFLASKCLGFEEIFYPPPGAEAERRNSFALPAGDDVREFREFLSFLYTDRIPAESIIGIMKFGTRFKVGTHNREE
jgi:hypothetical protein